MVFGLLALTDVNCRTEKTFLLLSCAGRRDPQLEPFGLAVDKHLEFDGLRLTAL